MNNPNELLTAAEFARLFELYRARLLVIARSYIRDPMVAEDIVADSFIYLWENRERIELTPNLPRYIMITVKNNCLRWLRDHKRHAGIHSKIQEAEEYLRSYNISSLESNDPQSAFAAEVSDILARQIQQMPGDMRDVFLASRHEEMTFKEIAARYGLSENQVAFFVRKALKTLKEALKDYIVIFLLFFLSF